jgi:hypothetical protein
MTTTDTEKAQGQARAELASIIEMVQALEGAGGDTATYEEALEVIMESPLSIEVRSGWHTPGVEGEDIGNEYMILLCTGGPAVRIVGYLNQWQEPETAHLEYQDWFTPWTSYHVTDTEGAALLRYARQFYFGE